MSDSDLPEVRRRILSFKYAFEGCSYVLRTQRNAWIHLGFTLAVVALGLWLGLSIHDWAILVITFIIVWVTEFTNTALEAAVDLVTLEQKPLAKAVKDVAAGSVLIGAIGSIIIGLLILGPPLYVRLFK